LNRRTIVFFQITFLIVFALLSLVLGFTCFFSTFFLASCRTLFSEVVNCSKRSIAMDLHAVRSEICSLIHELWLLKGYGSDFSSQLKKHQMIFVVEQVSDEAYLHQLLLSLRRQKEEILLRRTGVASA
jgi:hypothetical protein